MRHGKKVNHLGRKTAHRKAMLANMACSLIEHKRINTTVAKAKALQKYVEPLITKAKTDTTHSRRVVFSYLKNKYAVSGLFRDIAPKIADRPGGYTRILKTGFRLGDNAEMCFIELVDFNENMLKETKKKSRRSRRGGSKAKSEDVAAEVKTETTKVAEKEEVVENKETEAKKADAVEVTEEKNVEKLAAPEATAETTTENTADENDKKEEEKKEDNEGEEKA
ncbi:MAG: hypothetical protein Kow0079_13690 [Vicingaceae bacterium]